MISFFSLKYKESVFLIRTQGLKGFLGAVKYFIIRELYEFVYRKKPDEKYFLLQNRIRKIRTKPDHVKNTLENLKIKPKFSIVIHNIRGGTNELMESVRTIKDQIYKNYEIIFCFQDEESQVKNESVLNGLANTKSLNCSADKEKSFTDRIYKHILKEISGDFVLFLHSGDLLEKDTLLCYANSVNLNTGTDFIYTDEDFTDGKGNYSSPLFKPAYSPQFLFSYNYIQQSVCISKELLSSTDIYFNADDLKDIWYYLLLNLTDKANRIEHIPYVLYHNLIDNPVMDFEKYIADSAEINYRNLTEFFKLKDKNIEITQSGIRGVHIVGKVTNEYEKISIIIPFKDKIDLLQKCIDSIRNMTTYPDYEIVLVPNNCEEQKSFDYLEELRSKDNNIVIREYKAPFNFSALHNEVVKNVNGEVVLLLNNDIEVITKNWLFKLYHQLLFNNVGAVGAKLLYPDITVQHAGVVVGIGGCADHVFKDLPDNDNGYMMRTNVINNYSVCTAACLLLRKKDFLVVGGFDEENLKISFNDVDLCLKLCDSGKYIVYNPEVRLLHHESVSRGNDMKTEGWQRHLKEVAFLQKKWKLESFYDPFYNRNLNTENRSFQMKEWYRIGNSSLI